MNTSFVSDFNAHLVRSWQRWSFVCAFFVVLLGAIGLSGWILNSHFLKTFFSYSAVMRVNTAITILLSGLSLLLLHFHFKILPRVIFTLVLLVSLVALIENIFSIHLIDHLIIDHSYSGNERSLSKAPIVANFFAIMLTVAMVLTSFNIYDVSRVLATTVGVFIYASVIGLFFGERQAIERISGMAIHTALSFLFAALSLMFYRTDRGWMRTFSSNYTGGMAGRLTFTYLLVVAPLFLGSCLYVIDNTGVSPSEAIIALIIISSAITLPLVYRLVQRLNKIDAQLHKSNKQLELSNQILIDRNQELTAVTENLKVSNDSLFELTNRLTETTDELSHKNFELIRNNEDLDNIVHIISHDLKTPLTSLDASIRLFEQKLQTHLTEQESQLLSMIKRSVIRLKSTITDLTQALKSQKTLGEAQENVQIKDVLTEVCNALEQELVKADAEIKINLEAATLHVVRLHLQSILHNLLSNAVKYRSPDRKLIIHLSSKRVEMGIELSVADNGLGIPANKLPQLFSIFKRFHNHVEGTGIGLYIVKRIVENNHGRIHVDSEAGMGTRFTILFSQVI